MRFDLINAVNNEEVEAIKKWGSKDKTPKDLISAATEELGEVAHAINHDEGIEQINQEILDHLRQGGNLVLQCVKLLICYTF